MSEEIKKSTRSKRMTKIDASDSISNQQEGTIKELNVEISKYSAIDSILSNNKKTIRALFILFVSAFLFFIMVFVFTISLKKMYSYSDITTNALGVTTIKGEKSEVSYWLYNTAHLWADSGISVSKGDVITVRSSGKFITAIHHLYDNAKQNTKLKDAWVGSEGEIDNPDPSSSTYRRRQFRMFPNLPTGALVMQVANNTPYDSPEVASNPNNFYFIGKERENIKIENSGTLYFSLNDIVLNHSTIEKMLQKELDTNEVNSVDLFGLFSEHKDLGKRIPDIKSGDRKLGQFKTGVTIIERKDSKNKLNVDYYSAKDTISNLYYKNDGSLISSYFYNTYYNESQKKKEIINRLIDCGKWKDILSDMKGRILKITDKDNNECEINDSTFRALNKDYVITFKIDSISAKEYIIHDHKTAVLLNDTIKMSELEYYYNMNYKTAWFDDNLGSFLIIVEKHSSN